MRFIVSTQSSEICIIAGGCCATPSVLWERQNNEIRLDLLAGERPLARGRPSATAQCDRRLWAGGDPFWGGDSNGVTLNVIFRF